jgi:hypothetical protein
MDERLDAPAIADINAIISRCEQLINTRGQCAVDGTAGVYEDPTSRSPSSMKPGASVCESITAKRASSLFSGTRRTSPATSSSHPAHGAMN